MRFTRSMLFVRDVRGAAAVEFVLLAPIIALIMVGMIDFGRAIFIRGAVESAVSASANYVLVNGSSVTSEKAASLAGNAAALLAESGGASEVTGSVTVNNGPTARLSGGVVTTSGASANADRCFCPQQSGGRAVWGAPVDCTSKCGGDFKAGKFIEIEASRTYSPFFINFGLIENDRMTSRAMVQVQ